MTEIATDVYLATAAVTNDETNDDPKGVVAVGVPAVIEGGLHVEATARMLAELIPHLPAGPRRPMGSTWYCSATNEPGVVDRIWSEAGEPLHEDGTPSLMPNCQCSFTLSDSELGNIRNMAGDAGASLLATLALLVRERAKQCVLELRKFSPGCTGLHWIGPSREPCHV